MWDESDPFSLAKLDALLEFSLATCSTTKVNRVIALRRSRSCRNSAGSSSSAHDVPFPVQLRNEQFASIESASSEVVGLS